MGDILNSVDGPNLIQRFYFWGQATVQAKDFILDDGTDREILEDLREHFPDLFISVFENTLIIKSVEFVNLSILVISS